VTIFIVIQCKLYTAWVAHTRIYLSHKDSLQIAKGITTTQQRLKVKNMYSSGTIVDLFCENGFFRAISH
jgi:hypothetical protein